MASFWENLAEGLGWIKPNNIQHSSDISEEQKQRYRDIYADSVRKNSKSNPDLKISNAKNNPNDIWHGNSNPKQVFSPEWADDINTKTELLDFTVSKPTDPNNIDNSKTEPLHGRVLARVPKTSGGAASGKWFTPAGGPSDMASGNMGVYEAVLDDGTVLDASAFEDLLRNENYGQGFAWGNYVAQDRKRRGDKNVNKDLLDEYQKYKDQIQFSRTAPTNEEVVWKKNWRRWGVR